MAIMTTSFWYVHRRYKWQLITSVAGAENQSKLLIAKEQAICTAFYAVSYFLKTEWARYLKHRHVFTRQHEVTS
jgi:hypothetical protein